MRVRGIVATVVTAMRKSGGAISESSSCHNVSISTWLYLHDTGVKFSNLIAIYSFKTSV